MRNPSASIVFHHFWFGTDKIIHWTKFTVVKVVANTMGECCLLYWAQICPFLLYNFQKTMACIDCDSESQIPFLYCGTFYYTFGGAMFTPNSKLVK